MPSIKPKRDFIVFFSSSCTSQGKSHSHDVWYFGSRLLFPAKTSGWDSAFLLSPGSLSFVEFNCCVAWMSSLLVTVSSDFRIKPKRNKLMVAHQAAIFVYLVVRGKYVRGLSTNVAMNTCSWRNTWRKMKYSMYRRKDPSLYLEGGVRGVRKPQNRTEICQKTANRIGFFPEYRNRAYMWATMWKLTSVRLVIYPDYIVY